MKNITPLITALFIFPICYADTVCIKMIQDQKVIAEQGQCDTRVTPASTFKIALSLMGYDAGILQSSDLPIWEYNAHKYPEAKEMPIWLQAYTPRMWLKNSCVWYSQELTTKMGADKFQNYMQSFQYGNMDVSGNAGKNDGLTQAWLSSSLRISPNEQIEFLSQLVDHTLPASNEAFIHTTENLKYTTIDGHQLYGKTGMGYHIEANGVRDRSRQLGWFVGWVETDSSPILFVHLIEKPPVAGEFASFVARDNTIEQLSQLLTSDE